MFYKRNSSAFASHAKYKFISEFLMNELTTIRTIARQFVLSVKRLLEITYSTICSSVMRLESAQALSQSLT